MIMTEIKNTKNIKNTRRAIRSIFLVSMIFFVCCSGILAEHPPDAVVPGESTNGKIPLMKAIEKGLREDNQYKNLELSSEIAGLNQKKARMKKIFQVDFSGSYLFKSRQMEIVFPGSTPAPGVVLPGMNILAGAKHNYDLQLSVIQPIFTGGILSRSVELEAQKQLLEKHKTDLRKIEVAGMIKSSYFTFQLLESKKNSLSLLIRNLRLHLKKITDLYDEDLAKRTDLLETKIKISETEVTIEELNQLLKEEKINFTRLCGIAVEDIEKKYDESIGSFPDSLSFFETGHPALKTLDQQIRMLNLQKRIAAGNYLPMVNGFAGIHYGRPGIDFFANEWSLYFQGGLSVNFRIFDGNQLKKDKKIADISIRQLNNRKAELILDVKKKLNQLYSRKNAIEKQLEIVNRMVNFASEDAELKEELVKEQQVSNIDYLSALLDMERYVSRQDELILQVRLIKLNINTLIGRLVD